MARSYKPTKGKFLTGGRLLTRGTWYHTIRTSTSHIDVSTDRRKPDHKPTLQTVYSSIIFLLPNKYYLLSRLGLVSREITSPRFPFLLPFTLHIFVPQAGLFSVDVLNEIAVPIRLSSTTLLFSHLVCVNVARYDLCIDNEGGGARGSLALSETFFQC